MKSINIYLKKKIETQQRAVREDAARKADESNRSRYLQKNIKYQNTLCIYAVMKYKYKVNKNINNYEISKK